MLRVGSYNWYSERWREYTPIDMKLFMRIHLWNVTSSRRTKAEGAGLWKILHMGQIYGRPVFCNLINTVDKTFMVFIGSVHNLIMEDPPNSAKL